MMTSLANEVIEVIAARARIGDRKVTALDRLGSIGLESIDVLEIAFDLEQRFDIEIPFNANSKFEFDTIGDLTLVIEQLIAEKVDRT